MGATPQWIHFWCWCWRISTWAVDWGRARTAQRNAKKLIHGEHQSYTGINSLWPVDLLMIVFYHSLVLVRGLVLARTLLCSRYTNSYSRLAGTSIGSWQTLNNNGLCKGPGLRNRQEWTWYLVSGIEALKLCHEAYSARISLDNLSLFEALWAGGNENPSLWKSLDFQNVDRVNRKVRKEIAGLYPFKAFLWSVVLRSTAFSHPPATLSKRPIHHAQIFYYESSLE